MCHVEPKLYRKKIIFDKSGKPVIYVKMLKSLYGLLQSAILLYQKLVKDLKKYELEMNPYDTCIFNRTKNGKQPTVTFHVDDLKVSHMDPSEITLFMCYLYIIYGKKLAVQRGNLYDYLGINSDLSEKEKGILTRLHYWKIFLNNFLRRLEQQQHLHMSIICSK